MKRFKTKILQRRKITNPSFTTSIPPFYQAYHRISINEKWELIGFPRPQIYRKVHLMNTPSRFLGKWHLSKNELLQSFGFPFFTLTTKRVMFVCVIKSKAITVVHKSFKYSWHDWWLTKKEMFKLISCWHLIYDLSKLANGIIIKHILDKINSAVY